MTRFICLMVILTVLATPLAAQDPHILFCTQWGRPGKIDFEYMRELDADGFTVDFTEHWTELTAERVSRYHVLVIPGWVWMKNKEVFSHVGIPTRGGPDPEELRVLVRNHLEAGGGVLLAASRIGASRDCWERYNQTLAEYGARLPMERIEMPSERTDTSGASRCRPPRGRGQAVEGRRLPGGEPGRRCAALGVVRRALPLTSWIPP